MVRIRGLGTQGGARRARELPERLELAGGSRTPIQQLSKGNAQKVAVARAVLVRPELLVLDEPWSGLDISAHGVLAEILREVSDALLLSALTAGWSVRREARVGGRTWWRPCAAAGLRRSCTPNAMQGRSAARLP